MQPIVGVDFDNTIVSYDDVFLKAARELGLIEGAVAEKKNIRDTIRRLPDGEIKWQKLQAHVYGKSMDEARLIDGVSEFFKSCRVLNVPVFIVSHKTQFAAQDTQRIDLRQTALAWMEANNFFGRDGLGLSEAQVFFESTRQEKVARIKILGCTHFIDDLVETFLEVSFPKGVEKFLFGNHGGTIEGVKNFSTWAQIKEHVNSAIAGSKL